MMNMKMKKTHLSKVELTEEIEKSNEHARKIYTAYQSGITDLNAEDAPVEELIRFGFFRGSDFHFDEEPEMDAINARLNWYVLRNQPHVTELDGIGYRLDTDTRYGVAVVVKETDEETGTVIIGTYPTPMTYDPTRS